ncbi:MAG: serine hydrolase domain-containing protein, partial [Saccharopolyspora rectivirgula]
METSLLPATQRALLRRLAIEQSNNRVPSLIAGLVRDGNIIWVDSRGQVSGEPSTPDTQYRVGSITKSFVAVLVMRLRDEGKLDLADPLDKHLPGTAIGNRSIGELLSHSSGLTAEPAGEWWERTPGVAAETLLSRIDREAVRPNPRHVFHYSNVGFGVLGELVARLRGRPWDEVLQQEILDPLGMRRTTV